jgi:phosphopantothenoylcysteine decarboxylase/phosphopantothenate--cysteine ligase
VVRHNVETARDMQNALWSLLGDDLRGADALVMAAAVADYRPAVCRTAKIKKTGAEPEPLVLVHNPDLIGEVGARRVGPRPVLVAFALETGDDALVIDYAKKKLVTKNVDWIVANASHESLGRHTNRVCMVSAQGASPFEHGKKEDLADKILNRLAEKLRA